MRDHVLSFRTDRHHHLAKAQRRPSTMRQEVREIVTLAPILAQVNPSGVGTTVRLMRNLIGLPEFGGSEAVEAISAQVALFDQTAQRSRRRR